MCTIITVNGNYSAKDLLSRAKTDAKGNPHGFACLTVKDGEYSLSRGMDYDQLFAIIEHVKFDRIWIHTRMATQGKHSLANCHGWSTDGQIVMHNGFINGKEADAKPVDSMAINEWLNTGGVDNAMIKLRKNSYANVFVIDTVADQYHIHRSKTGSLHTDGKGNYSTNVMPGITKKVSEMSFVTRTTQSTKVAKYASDWYKGTGYKDWHEETTSSAYWTGRGKWKAGSNSIVKQPAASIREPLKVAKEVEGVSAK